MNEKTFYELIMGDSEQSYKNLFHSRWLSFLDSLSLPYSKALQLRIGNHLRPLLVYWGSALGINANNSIPFEDISELALCVEIMHKVSIIVDDLIDADIKRHNQTTFHLQFTPEETIIFAVYMIGTAFEKINVLSQKYSNLQNSLNTVYAKTLREMASGCLSELNLTNEKRYDYQHIIKIIYKETSSLIKNSLLLGFMTSKPKDTETIQVIELVGDKVGFLFQTMNDMEPFCSNRNISFHKGAVNLDFERSRKNIVLPYIYGVCSVKEKEALLNTSSENTNKILSLYHKYDVGTIIKNDLNDIQKQIEEHFTELNNLQINSSCLNDFRHFYQDIVNIAKSRLNTVSQEPID